MEDFPMVNDDPNGNQDVFNSKYIPLLHRIPNNMGFLELFSGKDQFMFVEDIWRKS